jgi:DNA-binding CsgD family transcriptional regulator
MAVQHVESLFERAEALVTIDDLIEAIGRGDGSVLAIEAAAGLGKTALLGVAREHAAAHGLQVASARGGEFERDFPFGIVRQLVEPMLDRAAPSEGAKLFEGAARQAAPVVGAPAEAEAMSAPPLGPIGQPAGPAMHGLYWLFANLAERGPLLIVVDDAHWADVPSMHWLHYLARRIEGLRLGVLLAARPGEPGIDPGPFGTMAAEPLTRVVALEPLTRDGSDHVVHGAFGSEADGAFCAACHEACDGNPFLLHELTGALVRDGVEPVAAAAAEVRALVPDAVARSLVLRLARLPRATGALARAVAVLGTGAALRDAAALAELDDAEAARAAATLAAVAILGPGLPLEFVHPLVRTAVYEDMPAAERAVWHARAARVLAAGGARAERVAAQLMRAEPAGDPWAVEQLRAAAADAMASADPRSAISYLRRAFVEPVPADQRLAVMEELVHAGSTAADLSAGDGLDGDPVAELAANPRTLQASAYPLGLMLWVTGRAGEADQLLDRARAAAAASGDLDRVLELEIRRITLGQLLPAEALRRLAPYTGAVEPDSFAGRLLEGSLAWYGCLTGRSAAETQERFRRAFAGSRLVTELRADALLLVGLLLGLSAADDLDLSEALVAQMLAEGRAGGSATAVANAYHLSANMAYRRGDLAQAEAHAAAATAVYREIAAPAASVPIFIGFLVNVLTERGALDSAQSELSAAGWDEAVPDHWWYSGVLWSRGYLRLAMGRTREGVDDLLEFARRLHRDGLVPTMQRPWASLAAPLLAQLGDREQARELAERELDEARAWGTPRTIGGALRGLGTVIGGAQGIERLRESVVTLEASPARLELARALIDLGAALRRANQRAHARDPLRRGLDLAHRCGARLLEDRAAHELRATGAKPRRQLLTGVEALTASERRVAEMAAEGLTNREIAQALFVTAKTVETHMGHVFQKLDVRARGEVDAVLRSAAGASTRDR